MEPILERIPLNSEPEAGTSNILKSLWFPTSTTPTRKSGQIVYGCASLLGEQWDFFLMVFSNWQGRWKCIFFIDEDIWRYPGPSWCGQPGEGCDPRSRHLCLLGPACSPPPWPLQFSCWPSWAWSWPGGPDVCSLETPCSQQWLCCCCCSSLGSRSSSGGSPRTPLLLCSG